MGEPADRLGKAVHDIEKQAEEQASHLETHNNRLDNSEEIQKKLKEMTEELDIGKSKIKVNNLAIHYMIFNIFNLVNFVIHLSISIYVINDDTHATTVISAVGIGYTIFCVYCACCCNNQPGCAGSIYSCISMLNIISLLILLCFNIWLVTIIGGLFYILLIFSLMTCLINCMVILSLNNMKETFSEQWSDINKVMTPNNIKKSVSTQNIKKYGAMSNT